MESKFLSNSPNQPKEIPPGPGKNLAHDTIRGSMIRDKSSRQYFGGGVNRIHGQSIRSQPNTMKEYDTDDGFIEVGLGRLGRLI